MKHDLHILEVVKLGKSGFWTEEAKPSVFGTKDVVRCACNRWNAGHKGWHWHTVAGECHTEYKCIKADGKIIKTKVPPREIPYRELQDADCPAKPGNKHEVWLSMTGDRAGAICPKCGWYSNDIPPEEYEDL